MICNKCNSEISENSKFCQACGNSINSLENIDPINNNTDFIVSKDNNHNQINYLESMNNEEQLNQISVEQNTYQSKNVELNLNQQQPTQNNDSKNNTKDLKILSMLSTLLGIIGMVVMLFHSTIAFMIFIVGIIVGVFYKSKTKNKCFGLTLNIIGLILNIIFFFVAILILNNIKNDVIESAKCTEQGGYMQNSKCSIERVEEDKKNNNDINVADGEVPYYLVINKASTYGNLIMPDDYIDIYMRAKNDDGIVMVGKIVENIKVLAVKDSNNNNIFEDEKESIIPYAIIFGVEPKINILLKKAEYLEQYSVELFPVPHGGAIHKQLGEEFVTSETLQAFIEEHIVSTN